MPVSNMTTISIISYYIIPTYNGICDIGIYADTRGYGKQCFLL